MELRVKTTDYKVPQNVAEYLDERVAAIGKLITAKENDATRCEVELGRAAGRHRHGEYLWFAEIQVVRPKRKRVVARNHEPTINAAIDRAKDEILRQLRKQKTVVKSKVRKDAVRGKRILRSR